ncbi:MAG: carboxylesterase family protein, partial [Oscillospiraceae bacterium]|nr:carboxylesterase family protein [Oscillospiraceae bacterium]
MNAFQMILFILTLVIDGALLELGKNTLPGWLLSAAAAAVYLRLRRNNLEDSRFLLRAAAYVLLVVILAACAYVSSPPVRAIPAFDYRNPAVTQPVTVKQGQLTGVCNKEGTVELYAGIPYAKPPVGELRWKEPQEPEKWDGIRACDTFAPMSMQTRTNTVFASLTDIAVFHRFSISLKDNFLEPMSEDSLYLNIWKPAGEVKDAPVLFFIHGGSLTGGQTSYSEYNGEELASRGIIVVNCAYRLGVFGYYASDELAAESSNGTTGNYGLLDQIQALRWVKENIAAFGGDADNITIAGESAGSSSVNAICVSPLAKGLFRRAVGGSSSITAIRPYHTFRTMEAALKMGNSIKEEFGCSSVSELRQVSAEKLVNTRYTNSSMTVDGYAITEQPYLTYEKGNNNEEALLNGFNTHEADLFMLFDKVSAEDYVGAIRPVLGDNAEEAVKQYPPRPVDKRYHYIVERGGDAKGSCNEIYSAAWFTYSHFSWSRYLTDNGSPVYAYWFDKDNKGLGSNHAGELPYFYGNLGRHRWLYGEDDDALSETMMQYLLNFVRTGDP